MRQAAHVIFALLVVDRQIDGTLIIGEAEPRSAWAGETDVKVGDGFVIASVCSGWKLSTELLWLE
jgi:hypothetical protein